MNRPTPSLVELFNGALCTASRPIELNNGECFILTIAL